MLWTPCSWVLHRQHKSHVQSWCKTLGGRNDMKDLMSEEKCVYYEATEEKWTERKTVCLRVCVRRLTFLLITLGHVCLMSTLYIVYVHAFWTAKQHTCTRTFIPFSSVARLLTLQCWSAFPQLLFLPLKRLRSPELTNPSQGPFTTNPGPLYLP